jgi:Fe-S cluster assembly scaffold protein SufB
MTLAMPAGAPAGALLGLATEPSPRDLARDHGEPDWLVADRLAGAAQALDLPVETNPLFTSYVDLRPVRFGEIAPYPATGEAHEVSATVPAGASAFLEVRENAVVARGLSAEAAAKGVIVDTFDRVLERDPALLRRLIEGGRTLPENDRFAQAVRAGYGLGVVVHVPDGVELAGPIVLRWAQGTPGRALLTRTVISVGQDAHASFLEEQAASPGAADGAGQALWMGTSEVVLDRGATLDVSGEENFAGNTVAFVNRHATVGESAALTWALAVVGGAYVKSRIDNLLAGRGGGVHQSEIVFGGGQQQFDLTSYTRHRGQDTTGDLLSKGVFQDTSRGFFKGLIQIERSARGANSFLGEFSMLLSRKARSVTIPSLEIDQPDVQRAGHSSSVGPIDEMQIFYLMSRGISRDLARKFIVLGFLEPVVARMPLPAAQERLRGLLDRKWIPSK